MTKDTNRQRTSRDGGVHLNDEQKQVDAKGCVDGELDFRLVPDVLLDFVRLLIFSTEELVDELILPCVVLLNLLVVSRRVIYFYLLFRGVLPLELSIAQRIAWPNGRRCTVQGAIT